MKGGAERGGAPPRARGGAAQGSSAARPRPAPPPCRSSEAPPRPAPLFAPQAAAARSRCRSRCLRGGGGAAASPEPRAHPGPARALRPRLPGRRRRRRLRASVRGPGRPQPQPRRAPPPAECMRLTLLCCTWREERMGEEGALGAGRRGADPGAGRAGAPRSGRRGSGGHGWGPGLAASEAGSAARPRPCVLRDELVLPKPAGPSLKSSHPVSPSSAPVGCPPAVGGPLLPFIPSFSHPPTDDHPGGIPGTARPALASIRVLCPPGARPRPPLIPSLTGLGRKSRWESLSPDSQPSVWPAP